ncbi:CARMIL pleckstrin-like proteiny domain-containing protein [Entamoeba marina]
MARILPYPLNHKKQSGGFLGVYKAFCASFGVRMNNALVFDITNDINIQTVGEEFTLDLSKYYNDDYNNTNEDSLLDTDMQPIFGALCDNRYFKKLVIKDVNLRKCYSKLKEIMSTNVTIESLSLINVSLGSKWSEVMDGYNYNPRHAIKHLDVSNNQMDSKGISAIGSLIRCFRLESLNMSNVLVKSQLFSAFLDDLRKTKGSIPLRSLNISGAHLYYTQVEFLCSLIKATLPFLSVLIMRNCEVPKEASLMKCVTVLQTIIKLDITGINFTQDQTRELVKPLGTRMSEITEIQFEGAVVDKTVLRKFIEDVPAHGVTLNLAHSSLILKL